MELREAKPADFPAILRQVTTPETLFPVHPKRQVRPSLWHSRTPCSWARIKKRRNQDENKRGKH